jgi:glycosyltransferase involved in cell wall biosynthesis
MGVEFNNLRVALVHYWLVTWGGGERVLRALAAMFPQADIFTVVATDEIADRFAPHRVYTSFLQSVPGSRRWHRNYLPLYPLALEQFDLRDYDLVISSNSGPAHGVLTGSDTCHISYCHSPIRYIWDLYHDYVGNDDFSGIARLIFRCSAHYLRMWDVAAAARVDYFAANSQNVARRIRKTYRRESTVVYPPVEMPDLCGATRTDDYYLVVGRLVGYKRVDLAIESCKRMGRRLRVVGNGPQLRRLRSLASGAPVEFLTDLSDEQVADQYAHCRALLFPGEDDFGMAPVEAQCFGKPVIAYARGGALETVIGAETDGYVSPHDTTGVFFGEQTVASLSEALQKFENSELSFAPSTMRANAARFSGVRFRNAMADLVRESVADREFVDQANAAANTLLRARIAQAL